MSEEEKLLVMSNFSFSNFVFRKLQALKTQVFRGRVKPHDKILASFKVKAFTIDKAKICLQKNGN